MQQAFPGAQHGPGQHDAAVAFASAAFASATFALASQHDAPVVQQLPPVVQQFFTASVLSACELAKALKAERADIPTVNNKTLTLMINLLVGSS